MKKILLPIFVFFLVAGIALAFFIATFNADRYRPLLTQKLEETFGSPVRLDHLSLAWHGGIALDLKGLAVYSDSLKKEPALELERASATLELFPLLQRKIQIGLISLLRPRLEIIRDAEGNFALKGIQPPSRKAAPPSAKGNKTVASAAQASLALLIGAIQVEDGEILLSDPTSTPPFETRIRDLDLVLKDISLTQPLSVDLRAALFGKEQNAHLTGELLLPGLHGKGQLNHFHLEIDLSRLGPDILPSGVALTGKLEAHLEPLALDPQGIEDLAADFRLNGGKVSVSGLKSAFENVTLEAVVKKERVEMDRLSAEFAGGNLTVNGSATRLAAVPLTSFKASLEGVKLSQLLPSSRPGNPEWRGNLSGNFEGTLLGKTASQISTSLAGQGQISVREGVLVNFNLLREVFQRISIVPGLVEKLLSRLPEDYKDKFAKRDTEFEPIELSFVVRNGVLLLNPFQVVADTFQLEGSGSLQGDGNLGLQTLLRIDPELSLAIIQSVNELQVLADAQGQLEIPVRIQGILPEVRVRPDLRYVASRLVTTKAEEWIGGLLQKNAEKKETTPQGEPAPQETQPATTYGDLLGGLLKNVLTKETASKEEK